MQVSPHTQAVLLLTAHFSKQRGSGVKPLTPREWGRFAEWLRGRSLTPERLLNGNPNELLDGWGDKTVTKERVLALLERGSALALSMEKWMRAGLWVMTRSDPDYPKRLKARLRGDSPAVLFGSGNRALLNGGGLAVIGSRKIGEDDLHFSHQLGAKAANEGYSIVSGGAKGVDESAMLGALDAEGTAVGVLADSLLRASTSVRYRRFLAEGSLVLVSPFNPEAGFNVGNAMQRNKYIYCLADAALAVHSGKSGGTWNGAHEDLNRGWVPLWVKFNSDPEAGNADLIAAGANVASASADDIRVSELIAECKASVSHPNDLFAQSSSAQGKETPDAHAPVSAIDPALDTHTDLPAPHPTDESQAGIGTQSLGPNLPDLADVTFYQLFLAKAKKLCEETPRSAEQLAEAMEVSKSLVNTWTSRAVTEGELEKLKKPVRYQTAKANQESLPFE